MLFGMAGAGRRGGLPLVAFLQVGRAPDLIGAITRGYERRLRAIGLTALGTPLPSALLSSRRAPTS
jgi:hypothetical protein